MATKREHELIDSLLGMLTDRESSKSEAFIEAFKKHYPKLSEIGKKRLLAAILASVDDVLADQPMALAA